MYLKVVQGVQIRLEFTLLNKAFIERTILPKGSKGSMKSQISVRLQYLKRRIFNRR